MNELVLPPVNRPFAEALRQVAETEGTWSVIGRFAVWCHLGESHRPTLDIDTAAAEDAHETLVSLGTPGDSEHRRMVEGVKVEIIDVLDPGPGAADLDDKDRLFITAHWAAARLTTGVRVRCEEIEVTLPVARRLPLIACKLHAWLDRRDQRAEKRGAMASTSSACSRRPIGRPWPRTVERRPTSPKRPPGPRTPCSSNRRRRSAGSSRCTPTPWGRPG